MSCFTLWGRSATVGQPALDYGAHGWRIGQHAFDDIELELGGAVIDCDHDGQPVGELTYCEVTPEGAVNLVGVVDAPLDAITAPVYWSPKYLMRGPATALAQRSYVARTAQILGASLTLSPATVAPLAVRWLAGDCRRAPDRGGWPLGWASQYPLLGRAVSHVGDDYRAERRVATRLVDQREVADRELERTMRSRSLHYGAPGRILAVNGRAPRAFTD